MLLIKIVKQATVEKRVYSPTVRELDPSLCQIEKEQVRCLACSRRCLLHENSVGFCTAVANWHGRLYSTAYGVIGEASVTPIENRPIYHYRPGTRTLCLGGLGCNLRCAFCQNWEVAFRDARQADDLREPNLTPDRAIALALEQYCEGIAWTFNEPSIMPMYVLDSARLAHAAGLYTVFVTNGYMTDTALDLLGPYIDVYRIDVKSLEAAFYQRVAGTTHIADMLPIARRAQQEFNIHVEVVTNLMPSLNDSDEHLTLLADQIVAYLGQNTPWHLTTYVPYAHMTFIPPTPASTLARAHSIGLGAGLHFVYTDDLAAANTANTYCPTCGTCVIERIARTVHIHALSEDGTCTTCGTALGIVVDSSFRHMQEGALQ
jgi:pyruvate formate lyase activating enzyme